MVCAQLDGAENCMLQRVHTGIMGLIDLLKKFIAFSRGGGGALSLRPRPLPPPLMRLQGLVSPKALQDV